MFRFKIPILAPLLFLISCSTYKTIPGKGAFYSNDLALLDSVETSNSLKGMPGKMRRTLSKFHLRFTTDSFPQKNSKKLHEAYTLIQAGSTRNGKIGFVIYTTPNQNDSFHHFFYCDIFHVDADTLFRATFAFPETVTNWTSARQYLISSNERLFGGDIYSKRQERKFERKMKRKPQNE